MYRLLYMNVSLLEDPALYRKCMALISDERKEKTQKLKNPLSARLSLGAGILLRIAMEDRDCADRLNEIEYNVHGKPYLKHSDFHFSISHSGEYAVCIYDELPIGIDLQKTKVTIPRFTDRILSESEQNYLAQADETIRVEQFYRFWAMKESYIKWDGRGLRIPLKEVSFVSDKKIIKEMQINDKEVFFKSLDDFLSGYTCCICSEKRINCIDLTEIDGNFLIKY